MRSAYAATAPRGKRGISPALQCRRRGEATRQPKSSQYPSVRDRSSRPQAIDHVGPARTAHVEAVACEHDRKQPPLQVSDSRSRRQVPARPKITFGQRQPGHEIRVVVHVDDVRRRVVHDDVLVPPERGRQPEDERIPEERQRFVDPAPLARRVMRRRVGVRADADGPGGRQRAADEFERRGCR